MGLIKRKSLCLTLIISLITYNLIAQSLSSKNNQDLRIWDNKPASSWMTEAYPLGNGSLGMMVFGGVNTEHIQFNESTLWTGNETETGAYQPFGDVFVSFADSPEDGATQYSRQLDLSNGTYSNQYKFGNVQISREYFVSNPKKVGVLHYVSSKPNSLTASIRLVDAHGTMAKAMKDTLGFSGSLSNGLNYASRIVIEHEGGTVTSITGANGEQQLKISGATSFTLLLGAATDYINKRSLKWHSGQPFTKVSHYLKEADKEPYSKLRTEHVADYQRLFNRVKLNIGQSTDKFKLTTRQRILNAKKMPDPGLETLIFQFGRYLLISSSRPGGLPANLQGIWNDNPNPPWRSDYHSNINIQMNYWPGEPTNLSECQLPYFDYINSLREVKKESTQEKFPGVRGWTVRTENNIFGGSSFNWNTPGSAWMVQGLWDHYAYKKDQKFLNDFAYPILKEIVEFWDDHLKRRADGTLVSPDGWSPEHGPTEDGVTHDQEIVYDLFTNYIQAATVLNKDLVFRNHVEDMRAHLLNLKIGKWGQLQEWETDRDDPNDQHRHVSHLFALYPGQQVSMMATPKLAEAARVSLNARGDASTGWSMAWKACLWARLREGDRCLKILRSFITLTNVTDINLTGGGIYSNLLCAHPPFQIDCNFGYTAAIAEMLIQSDSKGILLLPALPKAWSDGEVDGLCTRGAFEITALAWKAGILQNVSFLSKKGQKCELLSATPLKALGFLAKETKADNRFKYQFNTQPGMRYTFTANK